jgi:hypothetical protein
MPKVGTKQFPYTEEGLAMAREEAELVGEPIVYETDTARKVGQDMERDTTGRRGNRNNTRMAPRTRDTKQTRDTRQRPTRTRRMRY